MESLNFSNLSVTVLVLVAIASLLVSIEKGIAAWRNLSGKTQQEKDAKDVDDRLRSAEERIAECERRLDKGDKKFELISSDNEQILKSLNGLLQHFISGNDHERLKESKQELDNYLVTRRP